MNDFVKYEEASESRFNPVPSLFTLCNALCGFTAILYTLGAEAGQIPAISLWLIGGAMLFDVLDGLAARLLKAQSIHGMNLDSMADVVSFGAAPAVIIYRLLLGGTTESIGLSQGIAWFVAAFYLGCALWRLAQYNTSAIQEADDHGDFIGLPSPGAAALVCSMAVLIPALDLGPKATFAIYICYSVLSASLMVSAVPYTHIRRCLSNSNKLVVVVLLTAVVVSIFIFKMWSLVIWAHFYVLYAPILEVEAKLARQAHKHATML